jgi:hypothetical protein
MHHWSGRCGVPGGTERWEPSSYRWRRVLEAALVVALAVLLATKVVALAEVVAGIGLMALGLLILAWTAALRRRHRRLDLLALLLPVAALVEARKRPV